MKIAVAILIVLIAFGAYRLAQDYVRRSLTSFGSAERSQADMAEAARTLIESEPPPAVAKLVITMSLMAGCGCFVRGMLASHYLPRATVNRGKAEGRWAQAFAEAEGLSWEMRDIFAKFLIQVIIYDSFRNPFQGYLLRHTLENIVRPQPSLGTFLEARMTALSVVNSKRVSSFKARLVT